MFSDSDVVHRSAQRGPEDPLPGPTPLHTILVATDGSAAARDAIDFAVELASEHRSQVHFVHVVPTIDLAPALTVGDVGAAFPHEPSRRDYALLDEAAAFARERGVAATTALLGGSTAEEIVAYADSHDIDMTIVGSRGHGALSSAVLGSVSLSVLGASRRRVLIVHGRNPFQSDVR
jgi:nucleotide-binding universal stress UspA family protein